MQRTTVSQSNLLDAESGWRQAPRSTLLEFADVPKGACKLRVVSPQEWEHGKLWESSSPLLVENVTTNWSALKHWRRDAFIERHGQVSASMGTSEGIGQRGPEGNHLVKKSIHDFVTNHMHSGFYVFDRSAGKLPAPLRADVQPLPSPNNELWRTHLSFSIGPDLEGLSLHSHYAAWNVVVFGRKRWILWDEKSSDMPKLKMSRGSKFKYLNNTEWIRKRYPPGTRKRETGNCAKRFRLHPRSWHNAIRYSSLHIGCTLWSI